jgi:hypothetical protein
MSKHKDIIMMKCNYKIILIIVILLNAITNTLSIPLEPRLDTRYYPGGGNAAEEDYCYSIHALDCIEAKDLADEALSNAQNNFPASTLHNGSGDAYRHCY